MSEPESSGRPTPATEARYSDTTPTLLKYADFNYGEFLKRRNVRLLITFLIVILALLFGFWLSSIFIPLLVALMLAYILNPLVSWLERKGLSRFKAVLLIFASFFLVMAGTLVVVIPIALNNIGELINDLPDIADKLQLRTHEFILWYNGSAPASMRIDEQAINLTYFRDLIQSELQALSFKNVGGHASEGSATAFALAASIFGTFLKWMLFLTLVPLYTFYFMMGLDRIWGHMRNHLPGRHRERILSILSEIHVMMSAFFRGRLTICFIISIATTILFLACGVPFAVLLGLVGGFGVIIPFAAIIFSLVPALAGMLIGGVHSGETIVIVVAGFTLIQSFEQFWLTPRLLGKAVELHPVTLIVGVFVMYALLGIFGALLAVPLTAIAKIVGREMILPYFRTLAEEKPGVVALPSGNSEKN